MIEDYLKECKLCPFECKVNRYENKLGRCKAGKNVKIALASLHMFEEPCISGKEGSGTVFFSGCNFRCKFCQNYKVSQECEGKEITIEELSDIFIDLQNKNANNINLVTGFMYVPHIIEAIKIARQKGLKIPVVYNSSGYESIDTIKMLDGYVDIFLPDLKYYYDEIAKDLSGVPNYFNTATKCIKQMVEQVGEIKYDERGMMTKGVIVRHLVLPNHIRNSKMILKWLKENLDKKVLISVMAQYFPSYKALETEDVNRKLNEEEFNDIKEYVENLEIDGFMQELEDNEEQYVPKF